MNLSQNSHHGADSRSPYRPEIDGLRCVAVAAVIAYHADFPLATGGYVGVDVFFVISGYLITLILLSDFAQGSHGLAIFFERRVRRIFPTLFFVTACSIVPAWLLMSPRQLQEFSESVAATSLFASNFNFWFRSNYFGPITDSLPLIHTWSLSVEEQFYLVHPIALLLLWRLARRRLASTLWLVAAASFAACLWLEAHHPGLNFYFTPSRAWEFLAGSLVAVHGRVEAPRSMSKRSTAEVLVLLGFALIVLPVFLYDRDTPFPGRFALPPVIGTVLLLRYCTPHLLVGRLLAWRPLVVIGLASYSAYLWHQPVFAFARLAAETPPGPSEFVALIAIVALLSAMSLRWIEQPFRQRGKVASRTVIAGALVATCLGIIMGGVGHLSGGFPQRYDAASNAIARGAELSPMLSRCNNERANFTPPELACRYQREPVTWAVFGDSHGVDIAYALAERLAPLGQGVLHLTFSGCPPALDFEAISPGCSRWVRASVEHLEQSPVQDVLLVYRHAFYLYGEQLRDYPNVPDRAPRFLRGGTPAQARAAYFTSLHEIVRRLSAAGKRIWLLDPVPELGQSIDQVIFRPRLLGRDTAPDQTPPQDYRERRYGPVLKALDGISTLAQVHRLPTADALCFGGRCQAIIEGKAMYLDDNHMTLNGARRVVDMLAARSAFHPSAETATPGAASTTER